ncbi:Zn(2)-C6 fungal-type domain-containing protein [Fusarium sp. LHS14.1]|nr:Zn(2)-C6 fungal-type domain-containing protein [Fusarium sp. LHS14.1]
METRQRHCWECRRRRLVCDFTEPACKRCSNSGVECPGYSHVKPQRLKWLAPGRVTSRSRKQKGPHSPSAPENDPGNKTNTMTKQREMIIAFNIAIPRFELKTDVCSLPEAAEYFNSCIYRELAPIQELGNNPHIYQLSIMHIQRAVNKPDYLNFGMLCMTLSHRINRTRNDPQSKALAEKFYSYWGLAVRSLNEQLNVQNRQTSDLVMAGIMTLLLADVQQGTSLNWRCHLEGIHKLIGFRGGFDAVASLPSLEPLLLTLWFIAVIGNTTCPASDLIMTRPYLDALDLLLDKYRAAVSPIHMCPLPLFAEITRVNHLRMRAISCDFSLLEDLSTEGIDILERIHGFSPEQWASSKPLHQDDWLLIGKVYQAAAALYCILSLQSLSVLPETPGLRACCVAHGQILWSLLDVGLSCPRTRRSLVWPLVLLGVEAVHGGPKMRAFVSKKLPELSYDAGTYVPLMAKNVLESFWNSGETRWDACFDRPHVFTSQIAVDTSRISSGS